MLSDPLPRAPISDLEEDRDAELVRVLRMADAEAAVRAHRDRRLIERLQRIVARKRKPRLLGSETLARIMGPRGASARERPLAIADAGGPRTLPERFRQAGPSVLIQSESLHRGGLEQVAFDLARGLEARGRRVLLLATGRGGDMLQRYTQNGGDGIALEAYDPALYRRVILSREVEAAIIHHSYEGLEVLEELGIPILEVVHNSYAWWGGDAARFRAQSRPVRRLVAVSGPAADYHAALTGRERASIAVQPNALNPEGLERPDATTLASLRGDWPREFRFVCVAHGFPAKAHALLIAAFSAVQQRLPQARLELVGAFHDRKVAREVDRAIRRLRLRGLVTQHGALDRAGVSAVLARSHAFVLPSVLEGFSVAMTEAAYFGLPLILSDVGGASDFLRSTGAGILVPPAIEPVWGQSFADILAAGRAAHGPNRDALVSAMCTMIHNYPEWAARGQQGRRAAEALTLEAVTARYDTILSEMTA